jgi:predicted nucleotide-binding protein (sugar kinase/HSP70/actin superfamily)
LLLPEPNERNIIYSNEVTSGTECLPYRVTLGDFMRFCRDDGHKTNEFEGLMAGAFGPCRLGKYVVEQDLMLKKLGYDLPLITTVANNAYAELDLESGFLRLAFSLIDAVDGMQRLLWRYRPYEKEKGSADALFKEYLGRIAERVQRREEFEDVLRQAAANFMALADPEQPRRPLVGINGEIYLRSNDFSNCNLARACEDAGLEVAISPVGEWIRYVVHRQLEDALADRNPKKIIKSYLTKFIRGRDEHRIERCFEKALDEKEPSIAELLVRSRRYLSPKCGSEAVLSIGGGVGWLESPHFAGVISVMPHGCMPGGIVAAMSSELSTKYSKPWINVIYDGFMESNNAARINEFAERVRFSRENGGGVN